MCQSFEVTSKAVNFVEEIPAEVSMLTSSSTSFPAVMAAATFSNDARFGVCTLADFSSVYWSYRSGTSFNRSVQTGRSAG